MKSARDNLIARTDKNERMEEIGCCRISISLDFDVSTSSTSSSMLPDDKSTAVGAKSGKGLWCLIRVLVGACR
ncbi:unnamed protein product [Linum trigynum]|uniref:Uncharacterized protein n=1 Tax=Linum trigynum TaxID=586398 RepID=A0AAV2FQG3_9ROSI